MDEVVNFKDFSRPNKEINDFLRRPLKLKTFSRLYEPCSEIRPSSQGKLDAYEINEIRQLAIPSINDPSSLFTCRSVVAHTQKKTRSLLKW